MKNSGESFAMLKSTLAEALITRLQDREDIKAISIEQLSYDVEIDPNFARAVVNNVYDLFFYWFNIKINRILAALVEDFREDSSSSTHEKILEALMTILEAFADKRDILKPIHEWAIKDPIFGTALAQMAFKVCDRILVISGDSIHDTSIARIKRSLRIKGLIGLLIGIRSTWFEDKSDDLSPTFRELDKLLQQASEWAQSLRLLESPFEQ